MAKYNQKGFGAIEILVHFGTLFDRRRSVVCLGCKEEGRFTAKEPVSKPSNQNGGWANS